MNHNATAALACEINEAHVTAMLMLHIVTMGYTNRGAEAADSSPEAQVTWVEELV